jgi:hypothetical protein
MVDNIRVAPSLNGADPLVATDDILGIQYQKVKVGWGADGTWNETTDTIGIRLPVGGTAIGELNETAPASDTAAGSGLNGRLQRIAQRLSSLIALLPTALGTGGGLKVDGSGTALPVSNAQEPASLGQKLMSASFAVVVASDQSAVPISGTVTANAGSGLNTNALTLEANDSQRIGTVTETAPASDTASSGLNGRLQRIAQRLTSLIALVPTSLGQKTMANGFAVTIASDQSAVPVSGTFWQATQPVSGTVTANAGTNLNTSALTLEANDATRVGGVTETAPATDTASSGLNGRLQRIAQRLTTLIGQIPASLGQQTMANSLAVTLASNQSVLTVDEPAFNVATAVDAGDEATTDEAIIGAAANTRLIGFSARETTGTAAAVFNIRHGTSNAGTLLVSVSLGVSESTREWYGPDGIAAASGIWLERVSGQIQFIGYYKVAA